METDRFLESLKKYFTTDEINEMSEQFLEFETNGPTEYTEQLKARYEKFENTPVPSMPMSLEELYLNHLEIGVVYLRMVYQRIRPQDFRYKDFIRSVYHLKKIDEILSFVKTLSEPF